MDSQGKELYTTQVSSSNGRGGASTEQDKVHGFKSEKALYIPHIFLNLEKKRACCVSENIASKLRYWAQYMPHRQALVVPEGRTRFGKITYSHYTFSQLEARSDALAYGLQTWGLQPGDRVLVFLRPGLAFAATLFALFKLGAVPVFIDPGMGVRGLLHCVRQAEARALIGETKIHLLRRLVPWAFRGIELYATSGTSGFFPCWKNGTARLLPWMGEGVGETKSCAPFPLAPPQGDAAILFTSGSTGPAKGVVCTHAIFMYQVQTLQQMFALQPGDVDLAGFPFFSLFSISMGVTSVVADLNPSFPGRADPKKLLEAIDDYGVTFAAGSPAIWERVAAYCERHHRTLPSVRCLAMFGAPVRAHLHAAFAPILPRGTTYTPYGATECLPVTWVSGAELRALSAQMRAENIVPFGTCVGRPVAQTEIRIDSTRREGKGGVEGAPKMPLDEVGEIVVGGPQVTPRYWRNETATAQSKKFEEGRLWHRMGDLGYLDRHGRLWFCGRKAHAVQLDSGQFLYSIPCEAPFHAHPAIRRTALIAWHPHGATSPTAGLVIERKDHRILLSHSEQEVFLQELAAIAACLPYTRPITNFFLSKDFPVDTRHNIKIDRQALALFFSRHPERKL